MSDLISREEALSHPFANGKYDKENANRDFILGFESYKEWLETLPTVDIIDHARAIKEYCVNRVSHNPTMCDECPIYKVMCEPDISCPYHWDLPEGEKEPPVFIDSAPLKDCKNTAESYGEICVKCNKCGRFGKERK